VSPSVCYSWQPPQQPWCTCRRPCKRVRRSPWGDGRCGREVEAKEDDKPFAGVQRHKELVPVGEVQIEHCDVEAVVCERDPLDLRQAEHAHTNEGSSTVVDGPDRGRAGASPIGESIYLCSSIQLQAYSPFARGACDTKAQLIGFDDAA
jgi:hypothetical protein